MVHIHILDKRLYVKLAFWTVRRYVGYDFFVGKREGGHNKYTSIEASYPLPTDRVSDQIADWAARLTVAVRDEVLEK